MNSSNDSSYTCCTCTLVVYSPSLVLTRIKTPLPLLLPSPRARDPTSPQCSTPAPISGAGLQEWVGPHDRTGRVVMAVEGVEAAAWGACHGVSPSSHQERLQEIPPPNLVRPLPPCQGHRPPGSSTLRGLGTTLLHKVQNMCAPPSDVDGLSHNIDFSASKTFRP